MNNDRTKVIFVGSASRSGSTLVDLILAQVEDVCTVGEMNHIWHRGCVENQLCGCGAPFRDCDFWNRVFREAFGGLDKVNVDEHARLAAIAGGRLDNRMLALPFYRMRRHSSECAAYGKVLSRLYQAVREVSQSRFIVDSTKLPAYGRVLKSTPGIDVHTLHLVRDSRAIAYSWQRKKRIVAAQGKEEYMPYVKPWRSTVTWCVFNMALARLNNGCASYQRIRYEDVAGKPSETTRNICKSLGINGLSPDKDYAVMNLPIGHGFSGNPVRWKKGDVRVRLDSEWRQKLSRFDKLTVTALSWPLLKRYGYL